VSTCMALSGCIQLISRMLSTRVRSVTLVPPPGVSGAADWMTTIRRESPQKSRGIRRRPSKAIEGHRRGVTLHVLADGKHFRAAVRRKRRVAVFFRDDATRFGLGGVVGTDETAELFLRGLHAIAGPGYSRCQRTRRDGAGPGHWQGEKPSGGAGSVSTSSRVSPAQRVRWTGACASQMSARRR
jgi:hypothetical protein